MFFPIRLLRGRWPALVENLLARFCWQDPTVLLDEACTPTEFRQAMSAIHVGGTIKITGANRHPEVDDLLIQHVDLNETVIADIGASDGSTSLDLIERLPTFGQFVIADLYLHVEAVRRKRWTLWFAPEGECILVVGRHFLAWPSISRPVRMIYGRMIQAAGGLPRQELLLLNPAVRECLAQDRRVSYRTHDVFNVWDGPTPDVIKVANLLRRLYFSDSDIVRALSALHAGLGVGGHLLIVDNPRIPGGGSRGGLYQRTDNGFISVATTEDDPEIHDLIVSVTVAPNEADSPPTSRDVEQTVQP